MPKPEIRKRSDAKLIPASSLGISASFVIRASSFVIVLAWRARSIVDITILNYMKPVRKTVYIAAALIFVVQKSFAAPAKDPFAEFVRSTEARTPADELQSFHVPPGFEVQLFAAEPDIGKPMNMAF